MNWNQGYITDLQYLSSFYEVASPAHMRLIRLLAGHRPPDIGRPYRCLELGAGSGVGLTVLAAADPTSEFVGLDYNPGHIAMGRDFAASAGISNLTLLEADFTEIAEDAASKLGEFDFAICHGVYTWVSPEARRAIVKIFAACLKPGALVLFGYNSLPGWTQVMPLQKLILEHSRLSGGRSDERMRRSLAFIRQALPLKSRFITEDAMPDMLREVGEDDDMRYLVHEYMTEHWKPDYHIDITRDLAAAKLEFVGPANPLDLFAEVSATEEQRSLLQSLPQGPMREQVADYLMPRMFRRDIYARGATPISVAERARRLKNDVLVLAVPPDQFKFEIQVRIGSASLPKGAYAAIVEALAEAPCTVEELCARALEGGSPLGPEEIVGMLIGSGQALWAADPDAKATPGIKAFNTAIADFATRDLSAHRLAIAGSRLKSGIHVSRHDLIVYALMVAGGLDLPRKDIVHGMIKDLADRGERIVEDGKPVKEEARQLEIVRKFVANVLPLRLKHWQEIGAL